MSNKNVYYLLAKYYDLNEEAIIVLLRYLAEENIKLVSLPKFGKDTLYVTNGSTMGPTPLDANVYILNKIEELKNVKNGKDPSLSTRYLLEKMNTLLERIEKLERQSFQGN